MHVKLHEDGSEVRMTYSRGHNGILDPAQSDVVDAKNLIAELEVQARFESGIMPNALRWISADGHRLIFERPPHMRRIFMFNAVRDDINGAPSYEYRIPLPWTVYCATVVNHRVLSVSVYSRPGPIKTEQDFLCRFPMLNLYDTQLLCNPNFAKAENDYVTTIADAMVRAYSMVWDTNFNLDLVDTITPLQHLTLPGNMQRCAKKGTIPAFFEEWQKLSLAQAAKLNLGEIGMLNDFITKLEPWYPVKMFDGVPQSDPRQQLATMFTSIV